MAILRILVIAISASGIAACAIQRAQLASDAQNQMIGMTKEQILGCMGPPMNKAAEGATEVWSYPSGNGHTSAYYDAGFASSSQRFCTINVTMTDGRVSRMNYVGPTGGLLTAGEQCAFALQNCVQAR